jgi:hypothetical protein
VILGSVLAGVGLLLPFVLDWDDPARRGLNAVLVLVGFGLLGAGLLVFRWWRDRF